MARKSADGSTTVRAKQIKTGDVLRFKRVGEATVREHTVVGVTVTGHVVADVRPGTAYGQRLHMGLPDTRVKVYRP